MSGSQDQHSHGSAVGHERGDETEDMDTSESLSEQSAIDAPQPQVQDQQHQGHVPIDGEQHPPVGHQHGQHQGHEPSVGDQQHPPVGHHHGQPDVAHSPVAAPQPQELARDVTDVPTTPTDVNDIIVELAGDTPDPLGTNTGNDGHHHGQPARGGPMADQPETSEQSMASKAGYTNTMRESNVVVEEVLRANENLQEKLRETEEKLNEKMGMLSEFVNKDIGNQNQLMELTIQVSRYEEEIDALKKNDQSSNAQLKNAEKNREKTIQSWEKAYQQLQNKWQTSEKRVKQLEDAAKKVERKHDDALKKAQKEGDQYKKRLEQVFRQSQESTQNQHALQKQLAELDARYNNDAQYYSQQLVESRQKNSELSAEKQDLLIRLSEVAGANLVVNNPNITNLADPNRPTKLAEVFSELYDNAWTDAFDYIAGESDEEKIKLMYITLQRAFELCKDASERHTKAIQNSLSTIELRFKLPEPSGQRQTAEHETNKPSGNESEVTHDDGHQDGSIAASSGADAEDMVTDEKQTVTNETSQEIEKADDVNASEDRMSDTHPEPSLTSEYVVVPEQDASATGEASDGANQGTDKPNETATEVDIMDSEPTHSTDQYDNGADAIIEDERNINDNEDHEDMRSVSDDIDDNETAGGYCDDKATGDAASDIPDNKSGGDAGDSVSKAGEPDTDVDRKQFNAMGETVEPASNSLKDMIASEKDKQRTVVVETDVDTGQTAVKEVGIPVTYNADQLSNTQKLAIQDIKRHVHAALQNDVVQEVAEVIVNELGMVDAHNDVKHYVKECSMICWQMFEHQPPVHVHFQPITDHTPMDMSMFKAYLKNGKVVDYIVWPPIYLHEGGPMMAKGVAQAK